MFDSELLLKFLDFGIAGAFALIMLIMAGIIRLFTTLQAETLKGEQASNLRLIRILDERDASIKIDRDKEIVERMKLEHRLNEQCDEQIRLKEQITEMRLEIADKDKKIAKLILELDDVRKSAEKKDADINSLKRELAEVRSERDDLKKRLSALEAQQKDGETKS